MDFRDTFNYTKTSHLNIPLLLVLIEKNKYYIYSTEVFAVLKFWQLSNQKQKVDNWEVG